MITIHVEAHPDRGDLRTQIDQSLAAIGFHRAPALGAQLAASTAAVSDLPADTGQTKPAEPAKAKSTRKAADKPAPTPPSDPAPEVQAQDAADEKAESDATTAAAAEKAGVVEGEVFTRDSLRTAGGDYAKAYGMPATQEDGPKIIGYPSFGKVPDEEVGKATLALRAALEANPYNRTRV